jgi:hypothetical protein
MSDAASSLQDPPSKKEVTYWTMVYLLHAYIGRDASRGAEVLLERRREDVARPRISYDVHTTRFRLALDLFMFRFHDRRRQEPALAAGGWRFAPLARTTRYVTEGHHMFVGARRRRPLRQRPVN